MDRVVSTGFATVFLTSVVVMVMKFDNFFRSVVKK